MSDMNKPALLVMAAGMGSRYGGLKQIDPITDQGEIIMDFSIYDAMMAGFERVVFVIKKENEEAFRELIEPRIGKYMDVDFAFQSIEDLPEGYEVPEGRVKPWGTCHAVMSAKDLLKGPFAVINADDYYGPGAFQSIYDFLEKADETKEKYDYAMVGFQVENTLSENGAVARGVCQVDENGYLEQVVERTKIMNVNGGVGFTEDEGKTWNMLPSGSTVSMNFWGFTQPMLEESFKRFPAFLDEVLKSNPLKGEYFLPTVVQNQIDEGLAQVKVLRSQDKWYGVTYREDKESVVNAIQSMKDKCLYPEKLWK